MAENKDKGLGLYRMILVLSSFSILQCIICHTVAYPLFIEIISLWGFVFYFPLGHCWGL